MFRLFRLHNLRLGLATNSSSSHSLIFLSGNQHISDNDVWHHEYGWNFFTAASREAKLDYLSLMLRYGIRGEDLTEEDMDKLAADWTGVAPADGSYIDHQSLISFPTEFGSNKPNREFFEEFKNMVMSNNVVIGGGNDNTSERHHLIGDGNKALMLGSTSLSFYHYVARKDEKQDYWSLFNPENGNKLRVSFDKPGTLARHYYDDEKDYLGEELNITRSATPELVDFKITDFCSADCAYCYMGSTVNGKHGLYQDISRTLKALADMKVFEVAFGGGEPVHHPDFVKILQRARSLGIVPNFTTRNLSWISKPIAKKIMKYAGAFAVSIDNYKQVIRLAHRLEKADISKNSVNLHVVMGTITREEFSRILVIAARKNLRVTLLGYKDVGRGTQFKKMDYSWWLDDIKKLREIEEKAPEFKVRKRPGSWHKKQEYMPTISIDTVIAHDYQKQLIDSGIPQWLFHTVDGAFSAYIDGVNNKMGPASYTEFDKLQSFKPNNTRLGKELRKIYQSFDIDDRKMSTNGIITPGSRY